MSMFLAIADIEGDSTVEGFAKQIEVGSFSFSTSQSTSPIRSSTAHTSGRPSLSMFNFTKLCDKSSPLICKKLWSGTTLATADFTLCRDEGTGLIAFLEIKMTNVVIANYSVSGSDGGGVPYENVSLNYSKITFNYISQKDAGGKEGNIEASYDLATEVAG